MASFSKVILMGNVTRDPEIRALASGSTLAGFGIAINRKYKGTDGALKEETCFVDVTFFGKQAEVCGKYVHKGDSIVVDGRLRQDNWEKDGQKRSKIVVVGERLHLMPKRTDKPSEVPADVVSVVSDEVSDSYEPSEKPVDEQKNKDVPF